ncbi:IclR family transcriptional regulator [Nesterenkonia flava]|uniref:IclR family transcriptional regulator n=1 Tax=Nesterenkonia flava TaxID=469799 RepID=A0ABU1FUQ7_9MICC|nr:IclR family transcriptional regulator [Nesterenkonia flava]MDR5711896.1 IclR family transcriptional regulator [Nesterenkonia flava]
MAETSTRTVERALELVAAVCERGQASLAEAARDADLPASTALRLMRTLEGQSFLTRNDDGTYRPGSRLIQLGAQAFSRQMLASLARSPMEDVVSATGESVYLSIEGHRDTALYISIVEGTHSVRHTNWVGRTIPLETSAAGQVLRDQVPEAGYVVVESSVEPDVTAISAPVRAGGRVVAALSVLVPTYRIDQTKAARFGGLLLEAAQQVSHGLGETKENPR